MSTPISTPPASDYVHRSWASLVGSQHGVTEAALVGGVLIFAQGFLRTNPAWNNLQGKLVGGLAAAGLTYIYTSQSVKYQALRSHDHRRDSSPDDVGL